MPRVNYIIDGDSRPLERKLSKISAQSDKLKGKLGNLSAGGGASGGGGGGKAGGGMLGMMGGGAMMKAALPMAAFAAVGAAAIAGGAKIISMGADLETTRVQFQTFLGDAERGNALMGQLDNFANFTPFTNDQVTKAGRTLLSFGFGADEIVPTLKTLGDISAGTGKDLSELGVIFGQIKGAGRLMGGDLLQLINAGFNPLQVMSEKTGRTMGQLKDDMSKGAISFDMVKDAFKAATSEGGLFNNMTEKLSKTFSGRMSTLKGKVSLAFSQLGESILPAVGKIVDGAVWLFEKITSAIKAVNFGPFLTALNDIWEAFKPITSAIGDLMGELFGATEGFNWFQWTLNKVVLGIRLATLPIRGLIKMITLLVQAGDAIKTAFSGVGDIIAGTFNMDAGRIAKGFQAASGGGKEAINGIKTGLLEFAKDEATKIAGIYANKAVGEAGAAGIPTGGAASGMGGASGMGPTSSTGATATSSGSGISGGADIKNFEINISSLVESINFSSMDGQSESDLTDKITRILVGAVNNSQRLAGG
jgi:tape measure domain-containing protein